MPSDHPLVGIDQDRYVEAERLDAARDLIDLPRTVEPWIIRIERHLINRPIGNADGTRAVVGSRKFDWVATSCFSFIHRQEDLVRNHADSRAISISAVWVTEKPQSGTFRHEHARC